MTPSSDVITQLADIYKMLDAIGNGLAFLVMIQLIWFFCWCVRGSDK